MVIIIVVLSYVQRDNIMYMEHIENHNTIDNFYNILNIVEVVSTGIHLGVPLYVNVFKTCNC